MKKFAIILTADDLTILDSLLIDAKNGSDSRWLKSKLEALQITILEQRKATGHQPIDATIEHTKEPIG